MNFRQLFQNQASMTDYDIWRDKVSTAGGEIHPQRDRVHLVAQSWDGDVIGEFNLKTNQGWFGQQGVAEGSHHIEVGDKITWWYNKFHPNYEGVVRKLDGPYIIVYAPGSGQLYKLTKEDIRSHEKKGVAEGQATRTCPQCDGSGEDTLDPTKSCRRCGGKGHIPMSPREQGVAEGIKSKAAAAALAGALATSPTQGAVVITPNIGAQYQNIKRDQEQKNQEKSKKAGQTFPLSDKSKDAMKEQGVTEGLGKSIKRAAQGWGGSQDKPADIVKRNKAHDTDTAKRLRAGMDDAPEHTPQGLQKRVLDRKLKGVAEGSDDGYGYKSLSTEQIMKLIKSGNWEAVQDVVPDKHIQLRNNRNGKSITVHVKRDMAEGFDELDAYMKAKQAPQPSGGAGIKRGSYGMPGRKIAKGIQGLRPGGGSTGHTTPGNRDFGRPHSIPRAAPLGIDDYDANHRRDFDEGEYKDTVDKSKIPAVQRKAQGGDWKVSTRDLEHERSKSPTGAPGLAKAKQRLGMNENQQLPPEVIELLKKVAQSDAAPEHKKAIINAIMAKYQPTKDIAEEPKQTAREKFNKGLKRAGFDPDAAAKRLTDLIAKQKAEREKFEKENPAVYGDTPEVKEEKVRLDPKCWKGKKIGNPKTKMKGGVRVNNCVPK
jgi:hypothetical protein